MNTKSKQREAFYIKLNSAFAFIFILVVIASSFGIYILYSLGQVIKTTEQETFPATLAAMRLSERTALIAASAPALAAAANEAEIKYIYSEFERHMVENRNDLGVIYKMGDPQTLSAVKKSLENVAVIETMLRKMVQEKFDLSKSRYGILDNLLKLQADLDDTLGPLIWGTTSLTKLLEKRTVRMITQSLNKESHDIERVRDSLNFFTETALKPLQTALDIKAESALLMTLLNMAMHVASSDDIFPLENRASRSLNVFILASKEFYKGELSKRNPLLSVNLNRIEQKFTELIKVSLNPFDIRRREIEKELTIISLINQGREEARRLSQEIEIIVGQVQLNLHHQAERVRKHRITGVSVLVLITLVSSLLSILVAIMTTRALRHRDSAIEQAIVEAKRANLIKSQFLATMSHEIRTPMNSVLGFLELVLESDSLTVEQRKQLSTAHGSAQGLLALINDILDMNKLEIGKVVIDNEPFNLVHLIGQIFEVMDIKAHEKGIQLHYHIHQSLYCMFSGDALRIRQVLINLIGNSIKFTHRGGVVLKIASEGMAEAMMLLHFSIEDTGIGIAPERLHHIFDPFTQADSSTTRKYGGTGLGTTISKQIVELMGGTIWVESEEGKGSVFHFTLPLLKVDDILLRAAESLAANTFKENLHKQCGSGRTFRILVAEDVEANALLVQTRLKLQGHTVTLVKNGVEALRAFQEKKFDIILMDIHMPVMDGLEATTLIRKIEMERVGDANRDHHIPIIALTASIMKNEITRFLETGMDSFVGKPIDFHELTRIMGKFIPYKSGGEEHEEENKKEPVRASERANMSEQSPTSEDINFDEGIERWQDIPLYISSLIEFAEEYGEIIPTIATLIGSDGIADSDQYQPNKAQIEEAYRITHALKGVAANLSLPRVTETAAKINDDLHAYRTEDASNTLALLSEAMDSALNEIYGLKIRYPDLLDPSAIVYSFSEKTPAIESVPLKKGDIESILIKLKECIEEYSPDGIEPLIEQLEQYISSELLRPIKKYVDDFDFGAAGNALSQMIIKLKKEHNE